jgi:hypothetical protein
MVVQTFTGNHVIANMQVDEMCAFVGPSVGCVNLAVHRQTDHIGRDEKRYRLAADLFLALTERLNHIAASIVRIVLVL